MYRGGVTDSVAMTPSRRIFWIFGDRGLSGRYPRLLTPPFPTAYGRLFPLRGNQQEQRPAAHITDASASNDTTSPRPSPNNAPRQTPTRAPATPSEPPLRDGPPPPTLTSFAGGGIHHGPPDTPSPDRPPGDLFPLRGNQQEPHPTTLSTDAFASNRPSSRVREGPGPSLTRINLLQSCLLVGWRWHQARRPGAHVAGAVHSRYRSVTVADDLPIDCIPLSAIAVVATHR